MRKPLNARLRPVKIEIAAPTENKATPQMTPLEIKAELPAIDKYGKYGMTGSAAPAANAKKELAAAVHGEPSEAGSSPSSSRASVLMAVSGFSRIRDASSSAWSTAIPFAW